MDNIDMPVDLVNQTMAVKPGMTIDDLDLIQFEIVWTPKALVQQAAVGVVVTTVSWIVVSGIAGVLKRYARNLNTGKKAENEFKKF